MNLTGQHLGRYRIEKMLGKGGMAEVYLGWDVTLNRRVAIKVLPQAMRQNPILLKRFEREARAAANLGHPNIITIHDVGHTNGLPYIVMEYIKGLSLAEYLRQQGRLSPVETAKLV